MPTTSNESLRSAASYVLPAPPREQAELRVVAGAGSPWPQLLRTAESVRELGQRTSLQAQSLSLLHQELRGRLEALAAASADATRAQWLGAVREAIGVLDWCDSVATELQGEAQLATRGVLPIDPVEVCREVALRHGGAGAMVHVTGEVPRPVWIDAAALADVVDQALVLVAERTGGVGARGVEVGFRAGALELRIHGNGEPSDGIDPATVDRFRGAVARAAATVAPDELGPGGAGMLIRLVPADG